MAGTVLITGANGTLALEVVRTLLTSHPQYTVVAAVRNTSPEKDLNTAKLMQIIEQPPGAKVEVKQLDLGKLSEVRRFADDISRQIDLGNLPRISAILCNAATLSLEAGQKYTSDGLEATFQVCHLSHYLLVLKLLGSMDMAYGRVIMLGSITHFPEKTNPLSAYRPEFPSEIERLRYGTAKLANVTFMHDLNRRLEADPKLPNLTVLAVDPGGLAASRSQVHMKKPVQRMMATINFLMPVLKHVTTMFRPTADAARDVVAVSVAPEFRSRRGYYVGQRADVDAEISRDAGAQDRLWRACWGWSGLEPEETMLANAAA
ncbi:Uu.00g097620.m01.CDS01 [Anthostomella pinea]|uniref:3beta-hydroxysteroid 3-dehydrogenase n=1 Tax=Anthostomella pinea TaxID=933095 RepID=A0AAI8YF67_9PEZI|nr:Uu.00g097620.m01.CDS01 [Anthostomella pinea]